MKTFTIAFRPYTRKPSLTIEAETMREAIEKADLTGANLAGANLAGADLTDAYLAGADLTGANLAGANLAGADLTGAYLAGANLAGADLTDAYLAGAILTGANLAGANLAGANLAGADLTDANLTDADLSPVSEEGRALRAARRRTARHESMMRYRTRRPEVPIVEQLDAKILSAVDNGTGTLDMSDWHVCETTHCRAGWAIHLAGEAGYALEKKLGGAEAAGRAIYRASTGRSPYFFAKTADALADIRRCAEEDA